MQNKAFLFLLIFVLAKGTKASPLCEVYLAKNATPLIPSLHQRELLFQDLQLKDFFLYRRNPLSLELGRGLEGVADLRIYQSSDKLRAIVHKRFLPTPTQSQVAHLISLEGFRDLREFKKEGMLLGLEVARVFGVSDSKKKIYLEYIHGESILNLTHQRMSERKDETGHKYILKPGLEIATIEVLNRFDQAVKDTAEAWRKDPSVKIEYIEIPFQSETRHVALIVKDALSGAKIMDINIMNTVYDTLGDRLVIIDPY